ncbi:MAG: c-type cytochrome [Anaerolineales bacterium]|nr:c-type cytochrome [Anaerolineales bacterium]
MKKIFFGFGSAFLLALACTIPALAGGWAVITLDEFPSAVHASQSLEIGFMIRQHGVTPLSGQRPIITASLAESNDTIEFFAREEGQAGHYAAEISLPQAGEWEWSIAAFTVKQPMPPLTVLNAVPAASKPVSSSFNSLPLFAAGFGLLGVLGGLLALQRKVRWAAALVLAGFLVSGAGFASAADQPTAESEAQEIVVISAESQAELGRDLFIAKGCMLCHSHAETDNLREFGVDMGPNLTSYSASPEFLRLWLKDPLTVKSTAQMPTLGLSDSEIEALIAFINSD